MTDKPPLQSHHHIKRLQKQVDEAWKVRQILIVAGKVTQEEFEQAEALVRDLAPSERAVLSTEKPK